MYTRASINYVVIQESLSIDLDLEQHYQSILMHLYLQMCVLLHRRLIKNILVPVLIAIPEEYWTQHGGYILYRKHLQQVTRQGTCECISEPSEMSFPNVDGLLYTLYNHSSYHWELHQFKLYISEGITALLCESMMMAAFVFMIHSCTNPPGKRGCS